ncbi:MAG TPA: sigma-70 family RNA polymerase sigma factor, partial [Candidatus Bathyarchaeia archaeon]|nr:sigma-70 family RNA polymerase sigma factor [Candidatus Bathyarchaeia archaeon]
RKLYQAYESQLMNFILKKIGNRKDAEEILQDTFVSALDSLPLFSFKSSLLTWLCSIARHETADFYRRKKLKTIIFSRLPFLKKIIDQALGPELTLQEKQAKARIYHTFRNLSEGYSQILRLKYIDGLTMAQIAKKLGTTIKAVESRLFRARLAFQEEYINQDERAKRKDPRDFEENWQVFSSTGNKGELSSQP